MPRATVSVTWSPGWAAAKAPLPPSRGFAVRRCRWQCCALSAGRPGWPRWPSARRGRPPRFRTGGHLLGCQFAGRRVAAAFGVVFGPHSRQRHNAGCRAGLAAGQDCIEPELRRWGRYAAGHYTGPMGCRPLVLPEAGSPAKSVVLLRRRRLLPGPPAGQADPAVAGIVLPCSDAEDGGTSQRSASRLSSSSRRRISSGSASDWLWCAAVADFWMARAVAASVPRSIIQVP